MSTIGFLPVAGPEATTNRQVFWDGKRSSGPFMTGIASLPMRAAVVVSSITLGAAFFRRIKMRPRVPVGRVLVASGAGINATSDYGAHVLPLLLVAG